jgi:hypothetical protein
MEIAPKAFYNSLKMNCLHDSSQKIDAWKIEDLRSVPLDKLFSRLVEKHIVLDRASFNAYAYEFDTPEELAIAIIPETDEEPDAAFLILFELWRRLAAEKPTISIVCDELDYQITMFDMGTLSSLEPLDDAFQSFYTVLQENVDSGLIPAEAFIALSEHCAHDIGQFLYDYISELIGDEEFSYALELIERYYPFVFDKRYFEFLQAQLDAVDAPRVSYERIKSILAASDTPPALNLNIDILTFLSMGIFPDLFCEAAKKTIPLLVDNEDLDEFLRLSRHYFTGRDGGHAKLAGIDLCIEKMGLSDATRRELLKLFTHSS